MISLLAPALENCWEWVQPTTLLIYNVQIDNQISINILLYESLVSSAEYKAAENILNMILHHSHAISS